MTIVLADDRTGALETAGELAERGLPVRVGVTIEAGRAVQVVDAGTRHLPPTEVAAAIDAATAGSVVDAHKLDSLLRGNWATELAHLAAGGGRARRVLMVPAAPGLGRRCVGGVVSADSIPVDQLADARGAATTSRPAAALGADEIGVDMVPRWLAGSGSLAVCDAASFDDVLGIAAALDGQADLLISAPAAVLGVLLGGPVRSSAVRPTLSGPFVAIVGSVHPLAVAQANAAERSGATVIRSDMSLGSADEVLADLAQRSRPMLAAAGAIVIVGGDSAAAVLGDDPVVVRGLFAPGMPWFSSTRCGQAIVVTKPGSFGSVDTLVELFSGRMSG